MRNRYILLVALFLPLFGMNAFAQSNNFHVQVQFYGHWIDGDRIGDGTSLPDPTFRLWTNLHTGSQSGQSLGSFGSNYYWLHLPNTNCYDCTYNSPITLINTNVNVPSANLNLSEGFWFNLRLECHENDAGSNETVENGDDWVQTADHNRRIQINPNINYHVSQEYSFATNGVGNDPSVYQVKIRIIVHRLDAFAPTLRYTNTAGTSQNLFCSGDPMRIYADYNSNFSGGIFEWQGSNDNGANWYWVASTTVNYIDWTATTSMPLIRCRLTRPCPSSVFAAQALNCVGTSYITIFGVQFPVQNFNISAGSGGTSDGWISTQGVPVTVGPPPPDPNAINTTVNNTCPGVNTGSINVSVASISSSFIYSLTLERTDGSTVANHTLPNGSTSINYTFSGLPANTYNVKVTLRNSDNTINCTSQKNNLTVGTHPQFFTGATAAAGACFGQNGSVTISVSGNGPMQSGSLISSSNQTIQSFNNHNSWGSYTFANVPPGAYSVQAANTNGCGSSHTNIVVPNAPSAVTAGIGTDNFGSTGNQIQCNGGTGEIRVTPSGGTPNYNISVSGGTGQNGVGSGLTATFLRSAGTYSITVTDANGCNYNPPDVTLNQPATALSVDVSTTQTGVCVSNGTATFAGQGGVAPYAYRINFTGGFSSTNTFSGLGAGDYTAFVRDATGCERSTVFTVTTLPALSLSASNINNVVCAGQANGSVTVQGSGGRSPYTYAIGNGVFSSNATFSGLGADTYTFRVRDADFCESSAQITVAAPNSIVITNIQREAGACNSTLRPTLVTFTGRANGTVQNPNPYLDISTDNGATWAPLEEVSDNGTQVSTRLNLSPGNYNIRIRDNNNCQSETSAWAVTPGVLLGISQTGLTHEVCAGDNNGTLTVGLVGDIQPYTLQLYRITGTTATAVGSAVSTSLSSHTFNNLQPGNYAVWVSNSAGCGAGLPSGFMGTSPYSGATITINARPPLTASPVSTGPLINCYGDNGVITVNNTTGGQAPYEYRLNNGAYQSSNVLNGALASNQAYVRDANQCVLGPLNVNIGLSPANNTLSVTPVLIESRTAGCSQGMGIVRVDLSSGTPPYEVKLIASSGDCQTQYATVTPTNSTSVTFENLEAGNYIACVRDAGGCTSNPAITVPLLPAVTINMTNVTGTACLEDDLTGSITFNISGGKPNYTVTLNNDNTQTGNASSTFSYTGLAPGNYALIATDSRGCTAFTTRQVQAFSNLTVSVSQVNISPCSYSNNGVIQVTPSGGVAPYTVRWLWDNTQVTGVANNQMVQRTGLPINAYSVRITDATGCVIQRDFALTGPVEISAVLTPVDALCSTVANGSLTVAAIGGTGALSYSINGNNFQSGNVFTGLAHGSYTLTIRDANLCTRQYPFSIGVVRTLTANATPTNPACFQTLTGSIAIAAAGGQQPYTYSLNGTAGPFLPALTELGAGSYNVLVSDADGCRVPVNNVQLVDPPLLTASATVTQNASCAANQGNLLASAQGGTPPYGFVWDNNPALNTAAYLNALPGLHSVVVTDAKGCTASASATIANIPPIFLNLQGVTPEYCHRSDGTATVQVSGGASPFQYAWSHNASLDSPSATGLASASYHVTVSDANGCTAFVQNIQVPFTPAVTVNVTTLEHTICDQGNGSITVTPSAAPGPFLYTWSHQASLNSPTATGLNSGLYGVTVTDANQCSTAASATVLLRPRPVIQFVLLEDVTPTACQGNTGSIRVRIQPGTGNAPLQYTWSHNANLNSNIASNLTAGAYSCTVSDFYGCTAVLTTNVWELPPPSVNVTPVTATCSLPNGSAQAQAFGGSPPYLYAWSSGSPNNPLAQNLPGGNYTLTVTDHFGCQAVMPFVVGNIAGPSALNLTFQHSNCTPNSGSIQTAPTGGTPPYQYSWSHAVNLNSPLAGNLSAGVYAVTVTDATGCSIVASQQILFQPPPAVQTAQIQHSLCANGNGLIEVSVVGTGPFAYVWTNNVSTGPLAQNLQAGNYTVTVTDANGCNTTRNFTISLEPAPVIQLLQQVNDVCGRGLGLLRIRAVLGRQPYAYAWSHSPNLNSDVATGLLAGTYSVTVTDANGCTAVAQYVITEIPGPTLQVSSVATAFCGHPAGAITVQAAGGTGAYTYAWSHNASLNSPTAMGLLPGGYSATVTDANQCTATASATVNGTAPPTLTLVNSGDGPCQPNDGFITVAGAGGTAPLGYAWSHNTALNSPNATGLGTGSYTVSVTDGVGCQVALSATITDRTGPQLAVGTVNASTCGFSDGSASVVATQGQQPYTYTWSHNAALNSAAVTGLAAGNYSATVADANGCSASVSLVISDSQGPTLVVQNATNAVCTPNNGSMTVAASGGLAPYTYSWSHNPALNAATAAGLSPGNYGITVTDANGCQAVTSGAVGFTAPPTATATTTPALCQNNTGAINVSAQGGTPGYSIAWNIPALQGFNPVGVFAGTYSATVTDASGCTATVVAVVDFVAGPLVVPVLQQNPACNQANGLLQVGVVGGEFPYAYAWSHNPGLNFFIANGLAAGSYTVTVTDANGCSATYSATLPNQQGPSVSVSATAASCGQSNGAVTAAATGGFAPLSYAWSHNAALNSPNATGLAFGSYTVTVTDANGCTATATVQVNNNGGVTAQIGAFNHATCTPNSGSITINATDGQTPYTVAWSHSASLNSLIATELGAGAYSATVTDAGGCVSVISQTLIYAPGPSLTLQSAQGSICQDGQGSIVFAVHGGTAPLGYAWSHNVNLNAPSATGLTAGSYAATVTDANGCTATQSAQVGFASGPQLAVAAQADAYCAQNNGSVSLNAEGGLPPLNYTWSHQTNLNSPTAAGLAPGNYAATVTDANGCSATTTATVSDLPGFTLDTPTVQNAACSANDGQISLSVNGGQAPLQYQWSHDAMLNAATASGLGVGLYQVTVTDAGGCARTADAEVQNTNGPQLEIAAAQNASCGQDNGSIATTAAGGQAPYSYAWSNGQSGSQATGLGAGTYQVTLTDASGCQAVAAATLTATTAPTLQVASATPSACAQPTGSVSLNAAGGLAPYAFAWSHDANLNSPLAEQLAAGNYSATVTDAAGCQATVAAQVAENANVELTLLQTQAAQCNSATGSAAVAAAGGTAPYSYAWSHDAGLNSAAAAGLAPGHYAVTATDAGGCSRSINLQVEGVNVSFDLAVAQSQDSDCGQATGSITISANGGLAPYTFAWSHDAALMGATATGLAADEYTVTATDANGCTSSLQAAVSEAGAPAITVQTTSAWCGQPSGTATVPEAGGFTYAWANTAQPGVIIAHTATATGLLAGTYSVTVTNEQNCSAIRIVAISELPNMVIQASAAPAACFGQASGSAMASISAGGTAPFSFVWSNNQSGGAIGSLSAGAYQVTATDANGCTVTSSVTVSQPPALTLSQTALAQPLCEASANGAIAVQAQGGEPPYQYAWASGQQTSAISGLGAGAYSVTATDANGCQAEWQTTLTAAGTLDFSVTTQAQTCNGLNNGQAAVTAAGSGPFGYQWSVPGVGNQLQNLAPGNYSVTVSNAAGCVSAQTFQIAAAQPIDLSVSATPSCLNTLNGTATATATGGAGGFGYAWSNNQTGAGIQNLLPGIYTVTVTDANGCSRAETVLVEGAPFPTLTIVEITQPDCTGTTPGAAQVQATGGTGHISYLWNDPAAQTSPTATNLTAGAYSVTATDANGCASSIEVVVEPPAGFTPLLAGLTRPACFGQTNGSATASAQGGSGSFTYQWNDPAAQTTATATNLGAGSYLVLITDTQSGCTATLPVQISHPPQLSASVVSSTPAACAGQANGAAQVQATGGTGNINFLWNDPAAQTSPLAVNLAAGAYTVAVTDANGCTASVNVQITEPQPLQAQISDFSAPQCFGEATGVATVAVQGGTGAYTFQWDDPAAQTTAQATGLLPGTFTVTVRDQNNCATSASVNIPSVAEIVITVQNQTNPACQGQTSGSIAVSAAGGTGALSFQWSNGQNGASLTNLAAGSYTVSVTDANGCVQTRDVTLDAPAALTLAGSQVTQTTCYTGNDGAIAVTVQGGTGVYTYLWSDPAAQTTATATGLARGAYSMTATDSNGCALVSNFTVNSAGAQIIITPGITNTTCQGAANGAITVGASGGAGGFSFAWGGGQTGAALNNLTAGAYQVTATDASGCIQTASIAVADGAPFMVDVGPRDTSLCEGEALFVDFSQTTHSVQWTSFKGFTSQDRLTILDITDTYYLQVTNAQGCVARDTINLTVAVEPLQAFFVMATDVVAGREVAVVEVSWPAPQQVEWFYHPDSVQYVREENHQHIFRFLHVGNVRLGMKGVVGNCEDYIYKVITVHADSSTIPGLNPDAPDILGVTIMPNPNTGVFNVEVELSEPKDIILTIYNLNGSPQERRIRRGLSSYNESYNLNVGPGAYFLIVQSPRQRRTFAFNVVSP